MTTSTAPATTPSTVPSGTIVVGIDGSVGAGQALDWAVDQATLEHRPLTLLYSAHLAMGGNSLWLGQPGVDMAALLDDIRVAGHTMLDDAQQRAIRRSPDLVVIQVLSSEDPRQALLDLAEQAGTVVMGSRGRGPIASVLLGSVSVHVAKHADCPVVIVRHAATTAPRGGVVVHVDGTEPSRAAIEFAYRTASFRSLPLTALRVVWDRALPRDDGRVVVDTDPGLDAERLVLSEATAGMREKFPDVQDRLELVRGQRARELVHASDGADLLVLGARHQGGIDDLLLGSVAAVIERAACDVAVVHSPETAAS